MNWTEVTEKIADSLLNDIDKRGSYDKDTIHAALRKAALMGIEYECENWVTKRK